MNRQSGFLVMVVAILIIVIGGILASAFVKMNITSTNTVLTNNSLMSAFYLAETGLDKGSYQLTQGISWCDGTWSELTTVTGQGEYRYNCTRNLATTALANALSATDTSISLTSIPSVPSPGMASFGSITIDSETIYYDGISGNTLQNARRGKNGTVAAIHNSNAVVTQAQYIITSEGGTPSLTSSTGKVSLSQAAILGASSAYYAVGTNGTNGIILKYDGSSWSTVFNAPTGFIFRGIDVSANNGQAVGFTAATNVSSIYVFNGSSWAFSNSINKTNLKAVSCNSPLHPENCWSTGNTTGPQRSLFYHNGSLYNEVANVTHPIDFVTCRNDLCMAGGYLYAYKFVYTSGNPKGTRTTMAGPLLAADCGVPNTSCLVNRSGGTTGWLYYHNGSSYGSSVAISSGAVIWGISCPSTNSCMVSGNNGRIYRCTLPGINCALQATPGTMNLLDVYCISTTNCLAVGTGTVAYKYDGTSWTTTSSVGGNYTLYGVSGSGGAGLGGTITITMFHYNS